MRFPMPLVIAWSYLLFSWALQPEQSRASEDDASDRYSTENVMRSLSFSHSSIRKWYLEYQAVPERSPYYLHLSWAGRSDGATFARNAKSPKLDLNWNSGIIDDHWQRDITKRWIMLTDTECRWGVPGMRSYGHYGIKPDEAIPPEIDTEILALILAWWPFDRRPAPRFPDGAPCAIPQIVESSGYRVSSKLEIHSDRPCLVLENDGHDKLWLDRERNLTIVAREFNNSETRGLVCRIEHADHFEAAPGRWVARRVHLKVAQQSPSGRSPSEIIVRDNLYTIADCRLNEDVPDSYFEPSAMLPGALEQLLDSGARQILPGGTELFEDYERWIREFDQLKLNVVDNQQRIPLRYYVAAILVVLSTAAYLIRHRNRIRV